MKLIRLWEADYKKSYDLYNSFDEVENGFTNPVYGFSFEEFIDFVKLSKDWYTGINLPENFVPETKYNIEVDGNYIGVLSFRHHLNEFLEEGSGHIGYGISPSYRNKGYATTALKMLINEIKDKIKEDEIYMSANIDNDKSLNVQLKSGAYLHHKTNTHYYTRIKL